MPYLINGAFLLIQMLRIIDLKGLVLVNRRMIEEIETVTGTFMWQISGQNCDTEANFAVLILRKY